MPLGYQNTGNVIIEYDDSWHGLYGRLLSCGTYGGTVSETAIEMHGKWHTALKEVANDGEH